MCWVYSSTVSFFSSSTHLWFWQTSQGFPSFVSCISENFHIPAQCCPSFSLQVSIFSCSRVESPSTWSTWLIHFQCSWCLWCLFRLDYTVESGLSLGLFWAKRYRGRLYKVTSGHVKLCYSSAFWKRSVDRSQVLSGCYSLMFFRRHVSSWRYSWLDFVLDVLACSTILTDGTVQVCECFSIRGNLILCQYWWWWIKMKGYNICYSVNFWCDLLDEYWVIALFFHVLLGVWDDFVGCLSVSWGIFCRTPCFPTSKIEENCRHVIPLICCSFVFKADQRFV